MDRKVLKIHSSDNVLVALQDLEPGEAVQWEGSQYLLKHQVPAKHKFTIQDLAEDDPVYMYGILVGRANEPIAIGCPITTGNIRHETSDYLIDPGNYTWTAPDVTEWESKTFMGYHRANGQVGTANYWLVIPLVFCENRNIEVIREQLEQALGYKKVTAGFDLQPLIDGYGQGVSKEQILATDITRRAVDPREARVFSQVDGIKFLNHQGGCGGTRQDSEALCNLLAGYITHANVAGATVLSLGCQNAEESLLKEKIYQKDAQFQKPLFILEQQQSASENAFISEALKLTFSGLMEANTCRREPAPLSKLIIGLECGGSDGFSGLSANPALGYTSDMLTALGGTTILAEFPELNGVEQELINRCTTAEAATKFADLMKRYHQRAKEVGSGFESNPSPGNIKDGLITDAIKSAGAARKGGTAPITDVLDYTESAKQSGLNLLCTPGNDVESTTALAGSGANLIVFTTGLGTPTGNPVAPTIKVSSNTRLYQRMGDIIDFNTGTIISGEDTIESKGKELLNLIVQVASGNSTPKAVLLGQDDFIPWKRGVSL